LGKDVSFGICDEKLFIPGEVVFISMETLLCTTWAVYVEEEGEEGWLVMSPLNMNEIGGVVEITGIEIIRI
jgi:hypothetical protein